MPKANELKCYFGCVVDGPLHRYPKWDYPHTDKFDQWKSILSPATSARGNEYNIYNNVRICYRHFEKKFQLPSHRLTKNAVPTLNIFSLSHTEEQPSTSAASMAYEERLPATSGIDSLELRHIMAPTLSHTEEQPSTSAASMAYEERLPATSGMDSLELRHIMAPTFGGQGDSTSTALPNEERPPTTAVDDSPNSTRTVPPRPKRTCSSKPTDKAIVRLKEKLQKLREKCKSQSRKIRVAKKMATSKRFLKYIEKLPDAAQTFMKMQMRWKKKPRGRRYTTEEKIMSLTIMKQSPKAYKLLQKMFVLPSKRCLQKILGAFTMRPGINKEILENLKNVARRMPEQKKLVNLLFDEVSLSPGLVYNASQNEIIGFEDNGINKNNNIADHALVFMIKGIKSKTKQPISFTFCQNSTKKSVLKELLVKIIEEINNTGLRIVATICDQCSSNISTIKELIKETAEKYAIEQKPMEYKTSFEVNNIKVFPLFDPPHLLKGVRNNLLIKDAKFTQNGVEKWAKWEHLKMLLAVDVGDDEIRLVNKLTERHIDKDKIKKMKVKLAAQVFSQRVSSAMRFLSRHGVLPQECKDTADFLLIFDKLFDSFNGHSYQDDSKIYKCCIKRNSPHFQLWADLLPILESIKFKSIYRRNNIDEIKYESIPSIRNWIHNIKTFKEMWQYLLLNHNVVNLVTRNFNQDPLENFFSSIRSNGVRNVNPDCNQFMNAFKTLIINNFNSPHSAGANCEEDYNSCMQSLSHLILTNRHDSEISDFACNVDSLLHVMQEIKINDSILHAESKKYVTGYVIKKSKSKIFKNCNICLNDLCRSEIDLDSFNYEVDYTKKSLFHPNDNFITLMNDIYYMIVACLRDNPQSKFLIHKIRFFIDCACDFNIITCDRHKCDLIKFICDLSIKLIVHSWCLGVNRLLNGKISSFDRNDLVKLQAFEYCNKRKKS